MRKKELAERIACRTGISRDAVTEVIEEAAKTIMKTLAEGDSVYMRGFGCFQLKKRAPKIGRNISKGTTVDIPACNKPFFKPYGEFLEKVNK